MGEHKRDERIGGAESQLGQERRDDESPNEICPRITSTTWRHWLCDMSCL